MTSPNQNKHVTPSFFFSPPSFFFSDMDYVTIIWLQYQSQMPQVFINQENMISFSLGLGSHCFQWCEKFYNPFILGWLKSVLFLQHSVLSVLLLRGISPAYLLLLLFKERKCFQLPADKIRSE